MKSYKKTNKVDKSSKKYFPLLVIFLCYAPIVFWINIGRTYQLYTYIIYGILAIYSVVYWWIHRGRLHKEYPIVWWMQAFMAFYVIVACVKLYFVPSSIFFFQRLVCFCSFLSVGCVFLLLQEGVIKRLFRMWWRYVPWISLVSLPIIGIWNGMSMLFFVFLFMMLADCLRKQLRFITYAFIAFLATFCIFQRMDYIYVLAPISVFIMVRLKIAISYRKSLLLYHILMWIPVVFFFVAIWTDFNVLNFDSYIKGNYTSATGEDMTADTRTFLYEESIESALANNYVLFGRTPGYGYDSRFVKTREGDYEKVEGVKAQRYSEVFMVNIFTWCGAVGAIAWFVFYYWFGIRTLMRAKNNYVRGFVLYVGMFWICSWFSNNFCAPDSSFMMLYIILAICMQPQIQQMTNKEVKLYFEKMLH